jgi:hypothetical protein
MDPQELCQTKWTKSDWKVINWMEDIEEDYYNLVWEKLNSARPVISQCHAVFNSLRRICDLSMTRSGGLEGHARHQPLPDGDELITRLFGLKDWMTYMSRFTPDYTDNMYHRSCNISEWFCGEYIPLSALWKPNLEWLLLGGNTLWGETNESYKQPDLIRFQHIFVCTMNYHSMRTGQMESLLHSTNELISSWDTLISKHLRNLYFAADVNIEYSSTLWSNISRWWIPPPPEKVSVAPVPTRRRTRARGRQRNKSGEGSQDSKPSHGTPFQGSGTSTSTSLGYYSSPAATAISPSIGEDQAEGAPSSSRPPTSAPPPLQILCMAQLLLDSRSGGNIPPPPPTPPLPPAPCPPPWCPPVHGSPAPQAAAPVPLPSDVFYSAAQLAEIADLATMPMLRGYAPPVRTTRVLVPSVRTTPP